MVNLIKSNKIEVYFNMARELSKLSHDAETKVGCIIFDPSDGDIVSTGFNGPIRHAPDSLIPNTRDTGKYEYYNHSEENAIFFAAKKGKKLEGMEAVITLSPCANCRRALWSVGITTIYFKDKYRDFDQNLKMLDMNVNLTKYPNYYKMVLERKV